MNGSTTTATVTEDPETSWSSSQPLSSSITSNSSRQASSQLSKVYKQASTLYLTRRLPEALSTLESVITVPQTQDGSDGFENNPQDGTPGVAAVTTASKSTRIKIWSLYITLLSAIIDLGPDEGKRTFGSKEWKALQSKAKDGSVWDEIIQQGYGGNEGDVDADVVANLATLLLAHSPSQTTTQQRLETWLSMADVPNLDVSSHMQSSPSGSSRRTGSPNNGTNTPRELNSQIKVLEIYSLHVLPKNQEWDTAKEFINMNGILDDDRKEVFLHALQDLQDEISRDAARVEEIQRERDAELERQRAKEEAQRIEEAKAEEARETSSDTTNTPKKTSSIIDYGIESAKSKSSAAANEARPTRRTSSSQPGKTQLSPPPRSSKQVNKKNSSSSPPGMTRRASFIVSALQRLIFRMTQSLSNNPTVILKTLLFLVGVLVAMSRQEVRKRVQRITNSGWQKVKGTVGMGVKVSYI